MNRRAIEAEHLAALIDDPTLTSSDEDLAGLAGIARQLSALPRPELDERFDASFRVALLAAAAQGQAEVGARPAGWIRSRWRVLLGAAAIGVAVAGAGAAFASDSMGPTRPAPTSGPVVPTTTPGAGGVPEQPTKAGTSSSPPGIPGSGGGRSTTAATGGPPAPTQGAATPATTAPPATPAPTSAAPPPPKADPLLCVDLPILPELCL